MEWNEKTMRYNIFKYDTFDFLNDDELLYLCDRITRCRCISELVKNKKINIDIALECALATPYYHGIDEICAYPDQPERSKREDTKKYLNNACNCCAGCICE